MRKRIILVGGFHKTRSLADSLIKQGHKVTAVNSSYENCRILAEISGLEIIWGDGTKPFVLEDASAENKDIAIALTQKDDENLVICELCKKQFHIRKTVALISDPKKTEFFYKMGIDSVVCATNAISNIIEQEAVLDKMTRLIPIGEGRINIAEVPVIRKSPADGKKLWEINLPKEVIIGCILRGEASMIPRGDTKVMAGDVLILISSHGQELNAVRELTGK